MKAMLTVPRDTRWAQIFLVMALAVFAALLMAPSAHASSGYLNTWRSIYPNSTSGNNTTGGNNCQICHGTSTANLNPYGAQIATGCGNSGSITQRINAAANRNQNSDGDAGGFTDIAEINASTQPGWTTGAVPVVNRSSCNSAGTNTAPASVGTLDPVVGNTPPVANNNTYNTGFGAQLTVNAPGVLGNDTDADNDPLTAVLQNDVSNGTLSLSPNGSFIYQPNGGFSGADGFTYVANDGTDNSNVATVTINVAGPGNTPPVANDDVYQTAFNTPLNVPAPGVLGNDTDANGDALTAALQSNPSNGTLNSFSTNGAFSYTPNTGFSGSDSFTYLANDGLANSNVASVTITVSPQSGGDFDGDGIPDTQDNCIEKPNPDQRDTDGDGYGNVCDADLNNDDTVNLSDYSLFRAAFGAQPPLTPAQENADFNGIDGVNLSDYSIFRSYFGGVPGPSCCPVVGGEIVARPDTYSTPVGKTLTVTASRISGVLHNDTDPQGQTLTAVLVSNTTNGTLSLAPDGSFTYTPGLLAENQNDHFEYRAQDTDGNLSQIVRANIHIESNQSDFKIMMNYELGMHCTGFEFAYCCVLPVYNSILAQVAKPDATGQGFPELLEGDPNVGLDALGRQTVVRDRERNGNNFRKYVVKYWHDAQPRQEGNGKPQNSTLISAVEGNSLQAWNTTFDSVALNPDGSVVTGPYNGADGVMQGNGVLGEGADNYQNAVWNHLYFYEDLEGSNSTGTSAEADKIRLGVNGHVVYPPDCGAALHPMGPTTQGGDPANPTVANDCGGFSNGNVLTFSGHTGTVVFTQMKVLENLPIMLTSPDIWEALGLPLTPFEDTIDFFTDPGLVDEDSVRPFVAMKAQLHDYDPAAPGGAGAATMNGDGTPVIGFGTAPIDIPNCERCHSNPSNGTTIANSAAEGGGTLTVVNSPNDDPTQLAMVQQEYAFWNAYYGIDPAAGDSDWYSRLKSAAISILQGHDSSHGTSFAVNYPGCGSATDPTDTTGCGNAPQLTRLGHEAVICSRCHGQNVIAAVKGATCSASNPFCETDKLIMPITEALHYNHRSIAAGGSIAFADSQGRAGGCQGCHPAHRSDGNMNGYPITLAGANAQAMSDNRDGTGGCFVGRDVHSNPGKDTDGAETPAHLNAVGQYLADNVFNDPGSDGGALGIWCTNCHNQLGQEIWKTENMTSLVHGVGATNPRGEPTLAAVAAAVGTTEAQAISWLDPKNNGPLGDDSFAIWAPDPGLCDYVVQYVTPTLGISPAQDGAVAVVEVVIGDGSAGACVNGAMAVDVDCGPVNGGPQFQICGSTDVDGDFNVALVGNTEPDAGGFGGAFCTTPDCVASANAGLVAAGGTACTLAAGDNCAVPVPFSAATDGRDHWLASGEPHCADCHSAPYVEQSGNINAYPPFNYPRKASLMRYSRGHQDISCQGCHESIHGLYPVTPSIDNTSYAQAAALNHDGSHGPLKCGACHAVDGQGIPTFMDTSAGNVYGITDYDSAVTWAHTYTEEQSVLDTTCQNCHGVQGANWGDVSINNETYMRHAMRNPPRGSRQMMDKAETELFGAPFNDAGNNPTNDNGNGGICGACHGAEGNNVSCNDNQWLDHLTEGRVTASAWEAVSLFRTGTTCGW